MSFHLTPEQQQFRCDVQAFFAEPRVRAILRELDQLAPREEMHTQQIYQWLGERGWLAPHWPEQYGGLGKTTIEAAIVSVEMALAGVPDTVHVNTVKNAGTFLLFAGTPEQKRRFLPAIAHGDLVVSVLYTEPGAGSDLGSLTTRAERAGAGFKLYGRKLYSVKTSVADYGLVAARTAQSANRYEGITLFLVPLQAAGVQVNQVWNISDEQFNEVVFDGVAVEPADMIGPLHGGWRLINAALSLERTGVDYYAKVRRWLDCVVDHAVETGLLDDPRIGQRIAALQAQVDAGEYMVWHCTAQQARGELDNVAAAMSKWYNSEIGRPLTRLALELHGLEGALSRWDGEAPMAGLLEAAHRECPGLTISAGTSEMMLYVVSSALLQPDAKLPIGAPSLSDRQQSLQASFASFFAEAYPPSAARELEHGLGARDESDADEALEARIWGDIARLGGLRPTLPDDLGGKEAGQSAAIIVAEQMGRALYQGAYLDTLTAADILLAAGAADTHRTILEQIARGTPRIALAMRESGSDNPHDLERCATSITARPQRWSITCEKRFVACARQSQYLLLMAKLAAGPTLFLVPADRPGITMRRHDEIGRGELYAVSFDAVALTKSDIVGTAGDGDTPYLAALARARVRHAAYLVGLCQGALDLTVAYTKKRQQFGHPIASFQSLAFRLAKHAARTTAARIFVHQAAWQADQGEEIGRIASEALALVSDLAQELTADALQMHGSYGLTEQAGIQRYYRRAAVDAMLLGTPTQLHDEIAAHLAHERLLEAVALS